MTVDFPPRPGDCRQIEALLPPFVDGEASSPDASVVEAHLAHCAPCRRLAQAQRDVRHLLSSRRTSLCEPVPAALVSSVRMLAGASGPVQQGLRSRRWSPLAAAAAVVLAVTAGLYVGTGQSSVLLAAQLTLDHIKCFMIDGDEHAQAMTAGVAQVRLHEAFGFDVQLPTPREDQEARLVGVRNCLSVEGWVAHVLYRVQGEPVSMFVMPGRAASAVDVSAFGRHAEVVAGDGVTYVLVAPAQLFGVASALGLERE